MSYFKKAKFLAVKAVKRTAITVISSLSPHDRITVEIARLATMMDKPHASKHLDHYLYGKGKDVTLETGELFREDSGVCNHLYCSVNPVSGNGGKPDFHLL